MGVFRLAINGTTRLFGSPLKSMIQRVETRGEEIGTGMENRRSPTQAAARWIIIP